MSSAPIIRVDAWEMRKLFNSSGYYEMAKSGELEANVTRNSHPPYILAPVPFCTWSQTISYRRSSDGQEMARVHQYYRPDGTLGASGLPDPKRLVIGNITYRLASGQQPPVISGWRQNLRIAYWWTVNRILAAKYYLKR